MYNVVLLLLTLNKYERKKSCRVGSLPGLCMANEFFTTRLIHCSVKHLQRVSYYRALDKRCTELPIPAYVHLNFPVPTTFLEFIHQLQLCLSSHTTNIHQMCSGLGFLNYEFRTLTSGCASRSCRSPTLSKAVCGTPLGWVAEGTNFSRVVATTKRLGLRSLPSAALMSLYSTPLAEISELESKDRKELQTETWNWSSEELLARIAGSSSTIVFLFPTGSKKFCKVSIKIQKPPSSTRTATYDDSFAISGQVSTVLYDVYCFIVYCYIYNNNMQYCGLLYNIIYSIIFDMYYTLHASLARRNKKLLHHRRQNHSAQTISNKQANEEPRPTLPSCCEIRAALKFYTDDLDKEEESRDQRKTSPSTDSLKISVPSGRCTRDTSFYKNSTKARYLLIRNLDVYERFKLRRLHSEKTGLELNSRSDINTNSCLNSWNQQSLTAATSYLHHYLYSHLLVLFSSGQILIILYYLEK
ncbi:hypothetical protein WN51_00325 [Melipona quadrifasciata]|uniref:Uncharacterized protein n=1 Tax=Melipona quadrifasciata TaxID=166423 RepID=A0A0N0BFK4_9HYME|nr:hypothetical protein WN51_00325 [Melipona quadrifasciata]